MARIQSGLQINKGLIGYWPLGNLETVKGAVAVDLSRSKLNASLVASPPLVPGKIGRALSFNGSSQYAITAATQGPQTGGTWAAWVYCTNVAAGNQLIMAQYAPPNAYLQFIILSDGTLYTRIQQTLDVVYIGRSTASGFIGNNQWYHVVQVWNGGTTDAAMSAYANGVRVDTTNTGFGSFSAPYSGTIPFNIGCQYVGFAQGPFLGYIEDCRVWNRPLSPAEIWMLYKNRNPNFGMIQPRRHLYAGAAAASGGGPIVYGGSILHGAIIRGGRIAA